MRWSGQEIRCSGIIALSSEIEETYGTLMAGYHSHRSFRVGFQINCRKMQIKEYPVICIVA